MILKRIFGNLIPPYRGARGVSILLVLLLNLIDYYPASAQGALELARQFTKRAIIAIDLKVQRLQNKTIGLQNVQKAIENKLSELKLSEIGLWVRKQRDQYKKFYDELWKVRNTIATYQRVNSIIQRQKQMVTEYKFTWHMVNQDKHFTQDEISYMYRVYTGIIDESLNNLDQLILIINAYKLQLSDAKRLEIINQIGDNIEQNYTDLQQFNDQNVQLSLMRAKDEHEIATVKKLYGIQ